MAETKREYIAMNEGEGEIRISEDVVASIALLAAGEIEGVSVASGGIAGEIANLFGRKNLGKTVKVHILESSVVVDMVITIAFGIHIQMTTVKVQAAVADAIEAMCGLKVDAVNVQVAGVTFEKEKAAEGEGVE